jgi:hypothetical protein
MHYCGGSKVTEVSYGAAGVMGAEAITVTVPEPTRLPCTARNIYGVPCLLELPIGWPMLTDWRALGPLVSVGVDCAGGADTKRRARCFSNVA